VIQRYRRVGLFAVVVILAMTGPAVVAAADPPPVVVDESTVAYEAVLTVHDTDAVTLLPVDGASVHVTAHQGETVLGEYDATTDANGVAVLEGLPHETSGGTIVTLDVDATKDSMFVDEETGCQLAESWHAARLAVPVEGLTVDVAFTADEQDATSSLTCPGPTPSGDVDAATGGPQITPPATDVGPAPDGGSNAGGSFLVIGALVALAGLTLVAPRPRLRRGTSGRR
jgi:hypothetical protein